MAKTRFIVDSDLPRHSADPTYIIRKSDDLTVIAIVDPHQHLSEPSAVAHAICDAMNVDPEAIL